MYETLLYLNVTVSVLLLTPGFRHKGRAMSVSIAYVCEFLFHERQS